MTDTNPGAAWREIDTPFGTFDMLAVESGLVGAGFGSVAERDAVWGRHAFVRRRDAGPVGARRTLDDAARQIDHYCERPGPAFDLPFVFEGPAFQRTVWQALTEIPCGSTLSYGELAVRLGRGSGAAQAVGQACHFNPIGLLVPCHRVIGASGDLTGYGGGLEIKRRLLAHELGAQLLPLG